MNEMKQSLRKQSEENEMQENIDCNMKSGVWLLPGTTNVLFTKFFVTQDISSFHLGIWSFPRIKKGSCLCFKTCF